MKLRLLVTAAMLAAPAAAHATDAGDDRFARAIAQMKGDGTPEQLDDAERAGYRAIFKAIREQRWDDAKLQLAALRPGLLHPIATAELYLAKNSPKVELQPLLDLLAQAPELPQAEQIARLAKLRGATELPALPQAQRLIWYDGAPTRQRARSVRSDAAAAELAEAMRPYVKDDLGAPAEALVDARAADLTPEALTEWQQRVAWIYYLAGDDANARRMAAKAQQGTGDWVAQADWTQGLAAWREGDCAAADAAFQSVAQRASDTELRSAGLFWGTRADMACRHPERIEGKLQAAAQYGETFYGLLAREALGMADAKSTRRPPVVTADWKALEKRSNVRVAAALVEIGEARLADQVLRQQARIGAAADYPALTRLAGKLNLPGTELWLSHNGPAGARPLLEARYPSPSWTPDGGWRVDKALVFAHTLQESKFNPEVTSPAGAYGLMQIMPAAATDIARKRGITIDRSDLTNPAVNMEVGQAYLEQLRDQSFTGGLLPKVIAAYNAGPAPVAQWNSSARDNGDPLLYIESIPYWETRGYVMTVLRNYWMYEKQEGRESASRSALVQGLWPKFPGMPGAPAVRVRAALSPAAAVPVGGVGAD